MKEVTQMKRHGLFAAPLGNGDWMVGRANCVYSMNVGQDHYSDERLAIASSLSRAIEKWIKKNPRKKGKP